MTDTTAVKKDERIANVSFFTKMLRRPEFGALLGAIVIYVMFAVVDTTGKFTGLDGTASWTDFAAPIGIVAVFVSLLMIAGEFDLSTGVMVGTSGLLTGILVNETGMSIWLAMLISMLFAGLVGLMNGFLVIKTGLPSFIVTLATFFVLKGLNLAVTKSITDTVRVSDIDTAPGYDGAKSVFASTFSFGGVDFQITLLWWIGLTIVATLLLTRTVFGNWTFAAGGDANAARNAGVPVNRTKITLFVMTAMSSALVGQMTVLRLDGMQAGQGVGMEFYYIIAAAVGGTLLTGGAGSAIGASIGAAIMGIAAVGIPYALWNQDLVSTFLGIILFSAVLVNTYISRKARGARK